MDKRKRKYWIEKHTCLECSKVKDTTDESGKCYECRHKTEIAYYRPTHIGVCSKCKKESETIFKGFCLSCRRKYGYGKDRKIYLTSSDLGVE